MRRARSLERNALSNRLSTTNGANYSISCKAEKIFQRRFHFLPGFYAYVGEDKQQKRSLL